MSLGPIQSKIHIQTAHFQGQLGKKKKEKEKEETAILIVVSRLIKISF